MSTGRRRLCTAVTGAFEVVAEDGARGTIVLRDRRKDGTVVLLVCQPGDGPGGVSPPAPPPEPWYPTGGAAARFHEQIERDIRAERRAGVILDTSELPAGLQQFALGAFVERARAAFLDGERAIELNRENAAEWGWTDLSQDVLAT